MHIQNRKSWTRLAGEPPHVATSTTNSTPRKTSDSLMVYSLYSDPDRTTAHDTNPPSVLFMTARTAVSEFGSGSHTTSSLLIPVRSLTFDARMMIPKFRVAAPENSMSYVAPA